MAADLTQNFWGKHFEKIILSAAAAIFIIAFVLLAATRTHQDRFLTDAERLVKNVEEDRKAPVSEQMDKALTAKERTDLGIGQPPVTSQDFARKLAGLPPAPEMGKDFVPGIFEESKTGIVEVLPPAPVAPPVQEVTNVEVVVGRGTTTEAVPTAVFHLDKPSYSDIVWAGCAGQFDLTAQVEAYWKANTPGAQPIVLARVEMQRRELKADGSWSEWQYVAPTLPKAVADKWPKLPANPRDVRAVLDWGAALASAQAAIRLMPLYPLVAVDEEGRTTRAITGSANGTEQPPVLEKPKAPAAPPAATHAPEPAAPAAPPKTGATGEASPWSARPTGPTPRPGVGPIAPPAAGVSKRVMAWLSAYDTSVVPGATYQYQMRVALRNPVYSIPRVEDPKIQWALALVGEWSQPTQAITIPPLVQFYYVGTGGDRPNVELQRWILGQWIRVPSVQCSIGAPISFVRREKLMLPGARGKEKTKDTIEVDLSPQVVILDVVHNFPYQPEGNIRPIRTNVLMCADAAGRLFHRIEWEDKQAAANDWLARTEKTAAPPPTKPAATPPKPAPAVAKPPARPATKAPAGQPSR